MKKQLIFILLLLVNISFSQNAVTLINDGNSTYKVAKYTDAETNYRLAVSQADTLLAGHYDLANAIYKQKRMNEAGAFYQKAAKLAENKTERAEAYHNLGNVYFQKHKLEEAIEAYKNSLRNNPKDEETRYNLALAKALLKKKQKNNKNKDNKDKKDKDKKDDKNKDKKDKKDKDKKDDKNKDNKDKKDDKNKDNKDKKNKDKKDDKNKDKKDGDKKDKDKKDDKNKDNKDKKDKDKKDDKNKDKKDGDKKDKGANGQPQKVKLSPQEAKRLLAAMQNEEEKTQKKVKAQQVQGVPVKTDKDW